LRPAQVVLFALVGVAVALALGGRVSAGVGPFDTTLSARPALAGRTVVRLAPLGSIGMETHDAPVRLELRVDELRLEEAERIARDPSELDRLEDGIAGDVRSALFGLAARSFVLAVAGGAIGAMLARPRVRSALVGGCVGAGAAVVLLGSVFATFDPDAVSEPEYSGLLTIAPTAVGDVEEVINRFGDYRAQLTELVGNVTTLYVAAEGLPTFAPDDGTIRLLHVSDIHLNPQAFDLIELMVDQFDIDAVADTGDLTDWGTEPETQVIGRVAQLGVPYVWVRGNHDSPATQAAVAAEPNAVVLDREAATVAGLRFWGVADPRYTPNKDQAIGKDVERDRAEALAPGIARDLLADEPPTIDVALVHDRRMAGSLFGEVPLVLAGHTHTPDHDEVDGTHVLVEGSTGGAGLRGLQGERPKPLTCTVLYFDAGTRRLVAFDRVTVRGLGETGARIERTVIDDHDEDLHRRTAGG
jgi:predicted phosphodiesterase